MDGFWIVWVEGLFLYVNLMLSNNIVVEMSVYFDVMNVGFEVKDLSFVDNIVVLSVYMMMG